MLLHDLIPFPRGEGRVLRARVAALAALAVAVGIVAVGPSAVAASARMPVAPSADYPGDPAREALLVAAEDRRLAQLRAIGDAARREGANQGLPFQLATGATLTLVLTARAEPYTLASLTEYAPGTMVPQEDGSYLLSENIVVEQGATLRLQHPEGLRIRLLSTPEAFVSIATLGGTLEFAGSAADRVEFSSWDPSTDASDTTTSDGRSYIRAIGGSLVFTDVAFLDLGFWAGTTGGISLTGTEAPDSFSAPLPATPSPVTDGAPEVEGVPLLPTGDLATLDLQQAATESVPVSALMRGVECSGNAFGMFISGADGVDIEGSEFDENLVDGLALNQDVTNALVRDSSATGNALDGIRIARATTGVVLDGVVSTANGRNGVTLDGSPLADGPTATGIPVDSYGNNQVRNSTFFANERYGIDVVGGTDIVLDGNRVDDQSMGIVVSEDAQSVAITNNVVVDSEEQGIVLRQGVLDATVEGNSVSGGEIGIYLRESSGTVEDNSVRQVSNHGVVMIDQAGRSSITGNVVSGSGPSAIDTERAGGPVVIEGNSVDAWDNTKPLDVVLRSIFQPLTVLWIALGVVLLVASLRSRRLRGAVRHPYAERVPLTEFSAGVVEPEALGLPRGGRPDGGEYANRRAE